MINIVSLNKLLGHPVWLSQPLVHVSLQRGSEVQADPPRCCTGNSVGEGRGRCSFVLSFSVVRQSCMLVPSEAIWQCHHPTACSSVESGCGQGGCRGWESSLGPALLKTKYLEAEDEKSL